MLNLFWQPSAQIKEWLPVLQSHRGYCQTGAPENTLRSIQTAVTLGYQMVEFDVRLTKDEKVILFHDDFIFINGRNLRIEDITLAELSLSVFVNQLEDVLMWLTGEADQQIKLNIELKTAAAFTSVLEIKVVQLIHHFKVQKQVLISSFNPLALTRIRLLDSSIYRALLLTFENSPQNKWYLKKMILNFLCKPHALHLFHGNWLQHRQRFLKLRVPVVLWTYNGNRDELNFKEIHGIISDQIMPKDRVK